MDITQGSYRIFESAILTWCKADEHGITALFEVPSKIEDMAPRAPVSIRLDMDELTKLARQVWPHVA